MSWLIGSSDSVDEFTNLIRLKAPRLVVADEEFLSAIAAVRLRTPSLLISDKVPTELTGTLAAFVRIGWDMFSAVLIPDSYELFEARDYLSEDKRVRCVGPVIRATSNVPSRAEARRILRIPEDAISVLVTNGAGSLSRKIFEIANEATILSKYDRISWTYAGPCAPENVEASQIMLKPSLAWDFLLHLHACDVVVTGAGLSTLNEILAFHVPCVVFPLPHSKFQQRDARRIERDQGVIKNMDDCTGEDLLRTIRELAPKRTAKVLLDASALSRPAYVAAESIISTLN